VGGTRSRRWGSWQYTSWAGRAHPPSWVTRLALRRTAATIFSATGWPEGGRVNGTGTPCHLPCKPRGPELEQGGGARMKPRHPRRRSNPNGCLVIELDPHQSNLQRNDVEINYPRTFARFKAHQSNSFPHGPSPEPADNLPLKGQEPQRRRGRRAAALPAAAGGRPPPPEPLHRRRVQGGHLLPQPLVPLALLGRRPRCDGRKSARSLSGVDPGARTGM